MTPLESFFYNYTRIGDLAVIALCTVFFILLASSYVSRTRSYRIFTAILGVLFLAANANIIFHELLSKGDPSLNTAVYILRFLYHSLLFDVFFLFSLYTSVVSNLEHRKARTVAITASLMFLFITTADLIMTITGVGFRLGDDGRVVQNSYVFDVGYVIFVLFVGFLMFRIKRLLYMRVMYGFFATMIVSVVLRVFQFVLHQSSMITLTFILPAVAMMYIMHATPYNVSVGTLDIHAMEDLVARLYGKKADFIFMSLLLPDFNAEGKSLPEPVRAQTRRFSREYFRNGILFMLGNGQIVMIATKKPNPDYEEWMQVILDAFKEQYEIFKYPYKIVYGESVEDVSEHNKYADLIESVHLNIPDNTIHRVGADDIEAFSRVEYVLDELKDICDKCDLDDPRVLAYCQPVINCQTEEFDTAEALMRIKLPKTGMIFPDLFIPLAENHGYIHTLTEIILNKTCREIRSLTDEGFCVNRISVNISPVELRADNFCGDIEKIIKNAGIKADKIALELTETRNEADFMIMKSKIEQLHKQGIQFYLDDFGTGYSNMERIMEIPFDIIKFDRTMLSASEKNERSEKMVDRLAHMFSDMKYAVLYEGVENDDNEKMCIGMSAAYLQGYKYSRPVPIEKLREFLKKESVKR